MTQEEKWVARYNEVVDFIVNNNRNPSRHRIDEHDMLNWLKANRKLLNAETLKSERLEKFRELLGMMEQYKRKNQYDIINKVDMEQKKELALCQEYRGTLTWNSWITSTLNRSR